MIPGLPEADSRRLLDLIQTHPSVKQVVLYGSRALGRQRPGSDIDLCLEAPAMTLGELLELGGALDDLLLPWRIDLQLRHLIDHNGLLDHLERVGQVLWERSAEEVVPDQTQQINRPSSSRRQQSPGLGP